MLYALGEQHRIVGISGFTVRPPIARKEKPKVSAFTSAKIGEILKLQPDFVIGFSDIQAEIAGELIRHGVEVWISNHRSVDGILDYVRRLGALVGAARQGQCLCRRAAARARRDRERSGASCRGGRRCISRNGTSRRSPASAGSPSWCASPAATTCFPSAPPSRWRSSASSRMPDEVVRRAPDIILGSWCGKKFRPEKVAARPGWDAIPAVRDGELHEIKSPIILQPGPAALTDGVRRDRARSSARGRRMIQAHVASARIELAAELHRRTSRRLRGRSSGRSAACPAGVISTVPT